MRVPRVVLPGVEAARSLFYLPPAEARHVALVLRRKRGDRLVLVFEGGAAYEAEIVSVERDRSGFRVEVSPIGPASEPPPPIVPWTVAAAPARGERFEIAVEAAGELGLARLVLVETERSVLRLRANSPKLARWRRIARESAKQSGRAPPLAVEGPVGLDALLARWRSIAEEGFGGPAGAAPPAGWALAPGAPLAADFVRPWLERSPGLGPVAAPALFLVGPEGGLSPDEMARARAAGLEPLGFPVPVLRTSTAVLLVGALAALARAFEEARRDPDAGSAG